MDALELLRVQGRLPMFQLRIAPAPGRVVVLEFRPRDRSVARTLVDALRRPDESVEEAAPAQPAALRHTVLG